MAKAKLKTTQNDDSVVLYIDLIESRQRKADALTLLDLFKRLTGLQPKMWGDSIVGFGRYSYRYQSGREGEYFLVGFSASKANSIIYIMPGYQDISAMLERLGKHKLGKCCLLY